MLCCKGIREMAHSKKLISIIVPVLNEELNIFPFYEAVSSVIKQCSGIYDFEFIFTDNSSTDATYDKLKKLCELDHRVRAIRFSRNFGYQKSILAGYLHANGAAVIQLDCDLQDPPDLIPQFLKFWEEGNAVVYGIRLTRKDNFLLHLTRRLFYRVINYLSEDNLPHDVGDFRLVDRKIVELLRQLDDATPYLRGTIAAFGFRQYGISYHREERQRGKTNFRLKHLFGLALDGILNHSIVPLRIASFFGIFVSFFTTLAAMLYLIGKVFFGFSWPPGFTTLAILILLGISINALFLGIIGEYLGRIYQQVKKRPSVIIESQLGQQNVNKENKYVGIESI